MTSVFDDNGRLIPCTVIEAGPCIVLQTRTKERDGYEAVQLGFLNKREKCVNKPEMGQFEKYNTSPLRYIREFRGFDLESLKAGEQITVELFSPGEKVTVSGSSKGKGFQGVMRRHNFGGVGGASHGQHNRLRAPGSIGSSSYPSRVFRGMRMAGRMGGARVSTKNLLVLRVIPESNLLIVKGAVPGAKQGLVEIHKQSI